MGPATTDDCADRLREWGFSYGFTGALGEEGSLLLDLQLGSYPWN